MSDEVWNVTWCGMLMWCVGTMVVCCDARCEMWLWNTECGMVWCHIRHGGAMWNDGWNAVWDVCCGLECAPWDSVMCNLYLNVVMCIAWGGMWACDWMVCRDVVEWFAVNYGAMWNVVRCGMSVAIRHGVMWNAIEMQNVEYDVQVCGMLYNESCGKLQCDVKCGDEECGICNVLWSLRCVRCGNDAMCCDVRCGGVM